MPNSIGLNIVRAVKSVGLKAVSDNVTTFFGSAITINILNNDEYPIDKASRITVGTYSSITLNGNLTIAANKKTLTYTPKTNFFGVDTFTYNITDGYFKSNTATCSVSVYCKPPVIVDKTFKLTENKTYTLDILNPNCHPGEIIFKDGLSDRDVNSPQQTILIVPNSVVVTGNLELISNTSTTITFKTKPITDQISTTALTYKIKNNLCELDNTQTFDLVAGGSVNNQTNNNPSGGGGSGGSIINIGVITKLNLNSSVKALRSHTYMGVPNNYTQFIYADSVTSSDLSEIGAWYAASFDNYGAADSMYIIMRGKPILNSNGTFTERPTLYRGRIGPIQHKGRFVFYKPQFYNLELWVSTEQSGSYFQFGVTDLFNPINNIKYTDPNIRPTRSQVDKCMAKIAGDGANDRTYSTAAVDYSNTYTGTTKPSWA